jgi:hypothetical protein
MVKDGGYGNGLHKTSTAVVDFLNKQPAQLVQRPTTMVTNVHRTTRTRRKRKRLAPARKQQDKQVRKTKTRCDEEWFLNRLKYKP